uniref:Uncharacterized protein n=2 Tax=Hemiselmis andersenii TaxID=464988 RepID=A0A7S1MY64_HEMAN|mmetsp:Transcript_7698/g.18749  ORF Transcript_7698/g.18749 Transcript_7698/m.18749 type:complete len:120 (+) Transcript_7698:57-416(+)
MRVRMAERYQQLFGVTPGGTNLHIGRIYYEPQTDCSEGGEGTIIEVWEEGTWCRVKWDLTGESGTYWFSSMWTCLPHDTGGYDQGRHGCSPLVCLDDPAPPEHQTEKPAPSDPEGAQDA